MRLLLITLLSLLSASTPAAPAPAPDTRRFESVGQRPGHGELAKPAYRFRFESPRSSYAAMGWKEFRDRGEPRHTLLLTGLSGYDSHALSIIYKGEREPAQDLAGFVRQLYPKAVFEVPAARPDCLSLAAPLQLSGRLLSLFAFCSAPERREVYELHLSWQSLFISLRGLEGLQRESAACQAAAAAPAASAPHCDDALGDWTRSFQTLLSSFELAQPSP